MSSPLAVRDVSLLNVIFAVWGVAALLLALANPLAAMVLAAWVALFVAARVLGPLVVSPPLILATGLALVGLAGRLLYPFVVATPSAAGIYLPADPDLLNRGFYALTAASLCISVSAIAVGICTRRPGGNLRALRPIQIPRKLRGWLTLALPIPAMALIYMRDINMLLERSTYRYEGLSSGLAGGLTAVLIVTLVLSGYLLRTERLAGQSLVIVNIVLSVGYLLALGSRMFAAAPVLIAVGFYLARMNRRSLYILLAGGVVSLLIVPLPMYWRIEDAHGLIPYLSSLSGYGDSDFGLATTAKTILISVPITGASAVKAIPDEALRVALDPRPGAMAGWYDIYPQLMLNKFSPTSGVGELLNHGTTVLAVVFLTIGVYLGFLDRHLRRLLQRGHHLVAFAHVGFIALALVYLVQYHLRISARMLYYSAALWLLYTLWRKVNPVLVKQAPRRRPVSVAPSWSAAPRLDRPTARTAPGAAGLGRSTPRQVPASR
jgi:hypothetical protein